MNLKKSITIETIIELFHRTNTLFTQIIFQDQPHVPGDYKGL